ncbi:YdcF family protein [Bacillus tianshenii]|uniref:YdcF family protein n=1 Tax=Sutcliffiella tianshenii TaxID=1463404 RepID=UPI001CD2B43A|nr:YdcF family protein [Bacillus tianshenii]MCA1319100.1 YdcF family protein [Bacillus tianshenii]
MKKKKWKKWLLTCGSVLALYIMIVHFFIYQAAKEQPPSDLDYLIVLGARVRGEQMTLALRYRVEAALKYLEENPDTKVIVSGGQGPGEDITEAEAMERFFLENGVSQKRIIKEGLSTTTYENLSYSKQFLEEGNSVAIVSNDFHLFRASIIAERLGFEEVYTLPGKTPKIAIFKLWTREYFAVAKTWLVDR